MEQKKTFSISIMDIVQSKEFEIAIGNEAAKLCTQRTNERKKASIEGRRLKASPIDKLGCDGERLASDYRDIIMKKCKESSNLRILIGYCGDQALQKCFEAAAKARVDAVKKAKELSKTKTPRKKAKAQA